MDSCSTLHQQGVPEGGMGFPILYFDLLIYGLFIIFYSRNLNNGMNA